MSAPVLHLLGRQLGRQSYSADNSVPHESEADVLQRDATFDGVVFPFAKRFGGFADVILTFHAPTFRGDHAGMPVIFL